MSVCINCDFGECAMVNNAWQCVCDSGYGYVGDSCSIITEDNDDWECTQYVGNGICSDYISG